MTILNKSIPVFFATFFFNLLHFLYFLYRYSFQGCTFAEMLTANCTFRLEYIAIYEAGTE